MQGLQRPPQVGQQRAIGGVDKGLKLANEAGKLRPDFAIVGPGVDDGHAALGKAAQPLADIAKQLHLVALIARHE